MIGTSGWSYKGWEANAIPAKKSFYKGKSSFEEYASHFKMVELNCTFYKEPAVSTVVKWKKQAPEGFKYLVKVNRFLTHSKKLSDWSELFPSFYTKMTNLGDTLLGFLIQLPPQMTIKTLEKVVEMARFNHKTYPNTDFFIEFRHSSWFCKQVYQELKGLINIVIVNQYGVTDKMAKCFSPSLGELQNQKTMFRCHGTWESQAYCGTYSDEEVCLMASLKPDIVVFDNTDSYEHQMEFHIPGKCVFSREIENLDTILPSAIANAKRMMMLV